MELFLSIVVTYNMKTDKKIQLVIEYLRDNGGKYPNKVENKKLYTFISNIRTDNKMGKLSEAHLEMLKSIKFEFNQQDQTWYSHYNALKDFMINNNGELPRMGNRKKLSAFDSIKRVWVDEDRKKEYLLGKWLQTQRERLKNGTIKEYRKKLLESTGIPINGYQAKWEDKYFKLLDHVIQNNSLPGNKENPILYNWFHRNLKLHDDMKLTGKNLQLFEALITILPANFKRTFKTWEERYDELKNFKANFGRLPRSHRNVSSEVQKEHEIAIWLSIQKVIGRKHKLSRDKLVKLENLGVKFAQINHEKDWLENYVNYCDFIKKNNREPIYNSQSNFETKLSQWVRYNRNLYKGRYKNRHLPNQRYKILKNIDFQF